MQSSKVGVFFLCSQRRYVNQWLQMVCCSVSMQSTKVCEFFHLNLMSDSNGCLVFVILVDNRAVSSAPTSVITNPTPSARTGLDKHLIRVHGSRLTPEGGQKFKYANLQEELAKLARTSYYDHAPARRLQSDSMKALSSNA